MSDLQQSLSKLKAVSDVLEQESTVTLKNESVLSLHHTLNEMQQHLETIKSEIAFSESAAIRYVD